MKSSIKHAECHYSFLHVCRFQNETLNNESHKTINCSYERERERETDGRTDGRTDRQTDSKSYRATQAETGHYLSLAFWSLVTEVTGRIGHFRGQSRVNCRR